MTMKDFIALYIVVGILFTSAAFLLTLIVGIYQPPWWHIAEYIALVFTAIPVFMTVLFIVFLYRRRKKKI